MINSYTAIHQAFSADIFFIQCIAVKPVITLSKFFYLSKAMINSILPSSEAYSNSNVCVCVCVRVWCMYIWECVCASEQVLHVLRRGTVKLKHIILMVFHACTTAVTFIND